MTLEELVDKLIEIQNGEDYMTGETVKVIDGLDTLEIADVLIGLDGKVYIDPQ